MLSGVGTRLTTANLRLPFFTCACKSVQELCGLSSGMTSTCSARTELRQFTYNTWYHALLADRRRANIASLLAQHPHHLVALFIENNHAHGKAEVFEILANTKEIACHVVIQEELLDLVSPLSVCTIHLFGTSVRSHSTPPH